LGGKFADPILRLRQAALDVAGGNVHVRVDVPTKDELEELGDSFNKMVVNIRDSMQEIKSRQQEAESARQATEEANRKLDAQIAYLATLNRISNRFKFTTTREQLLSMVPELVCDMMYYDRAFFLLKEGEALHLTNVFFKRDLYIDKKVTSDLTGAVLDSDSIEFKTLAAGLPVVVDHLAILEGKLNGVSHSQETFALVPVYGKTDAWGVLIAGYCDPLAPSQMTEDELEKLTLFANNLGLSLDNVSILEDLERRVETRTQELERVNAKLNKEIAEKEDFLRAVSHDLSAPLRNVIGMTDNLIQKYGPRIGPEVQERLDRIKFNVDKEMELINELLQLSRIKTLRQTFEQVHVGKLLEDIRQELSYEIDKRNVQLIIDDAMPSIYCEKNRLKQVFQNLIDNAIKYTVNVLSPVIEVRCSDLENRYQFSVSDNGIGIDPDDKEKIFYVFRRAKNEVTSQIEGRGIGLSTVKSVIENYNGDIWVDSTPGQGSIFSFTLDKSYLKPSGSREPLNVGKPDGRRGD
jgi:signal transduction histidine kinase